MDMDIESKRKNYMRNVYSQTWIKKREIYGYKSYDKNLLNLITSHNSSCKILEVAMGDGFPFCFELDRRGYNVYGMDIAPALIEYARINLPRVNSSVGDSEKLDFNDFEFSIVYCFRSTWYFPNIYAAIDEMIRVTKNDGFIFFDVQNKSSQLHKDLISKRLKTHSENLFLHIFKKQLKNCLKLVLRPFKYYPIEDWSFRKSIIIESPTDLVKLNSYLKRINNITYESYGVDYSDDFRLKPLNENMNVDLFDRVVYKISK